MIDPLIPANKVTSDTQLQQILYVWKPFINVLAFVVLLLDLFPLAFGLYIFYYADGSKDRDIGQTTMMEAMANTLPYIYSLCLLCLVMTYIQKDLNKQYGGYRASEHQGPRAVGPRVYATRSGSMFDDSSSEEDDTVDRQNSESKVNKVKTYKY